MRVFLFIAILAASAMARAEYWTNQAGRVLHANLAGFDGVTVTLQKTNGTVLKLPLAALCTTDQRRVQAQTAHSIAPEFVLAAYRDALLVRDRFNQLPPSRQTDDARAKAASMACAIFDARIKARSAELTDNDLALEVKRLRALLVNFASDK